MAASRFRIQIIDTHSGEVCEFHPGLKVEQDFVADLVARTIAKKVGLFKSSGNVETKLRAAIEEAFLELKKQVIP